MITKVLEPEVHRPKYISDVLDTYDTLNNMIASIDSRMLESQAKEYQIAYKS